ncbi:hypothetical protein PEBR_02736 [Penicillium brasilianum]|uniref:Aminoglycoside phosphotransferase domain-containing protein n=1 Tax=Penicillium brasilianum TaxID=104259 RepID=A0A1S9S0S7_PENBI|nr:hypothetical protein PEBR_02736 [Penicillium brasilianum]
MAARSPGYLPTYTGLPFNNFGITDGKILTVAAACRAYRSAPSLLTDAGWLPFLSYQYAYWPVQYEDGLRVFVKVPVLNNVNPDYNTMTYNLMVRECAMLVFLENRGFLWSPRLLYHTMELDSLLGLPYMIETMLPGKRLDWTNTAPADKANREKVLSQVAKIIFEFARVDPKDGGSGGLRHYFDKEIDQRLFRLIRGLDRDYKYSLYSCFVLRALARKSAEGKDTNTVWVNSHENLRAHNIFVDDDFNVTGFVEWGLVNVMPARLAFRFPTFLQLKSKVFPAVMPADPRAYTKEFLEVPALMKVDRECFVARMQYEHATQASRSSIGHLSPKGWEMMCWDLESVDWSHMIFDAVLSRNTHQLMSARHFFISCLPEFTPEGIQEFCKHDTFHLEALKFYFRNLNLANPWANGIRTTNLLHMAACRRFPWEFIEIVLKDAFGRYEGWVDQRVCLR